MRNLNSPVESLFFKDLITPVSFMEIRNQEYFDSPKKSAKYIEVASVQCLWRNIKDVVLKESEEYNLVNKVDFHFSRGKILSFVHKVFCCIWSRFLCFLKVPVVYSFGFN